MKRLDLTAIDKIADKLPDNWTNFICDVSTDEGIIYEISSFSGDNRKYRCEIMQYNTDYWKGKCTCPGWSKTKETRQGKKPCRHLVAALLCQKGGKMKQEKKQENMSVWNAAAQPPKEVLRKIPKGRLAGKSDISPQWRYKAATELFGLCGIGWKYTIDRLWLEPCEQEIVAFAQITLWIKQDNEWSEPIPGIGGSKLVAQETRGPHVNDEAYKMATTDALSVAFKVLGFGADVYLGLWDGSKYNIPQDQNSKLTDWLVGCEAASAATVDEYINWWPKNKPKIIADCGEEGAVKVYEAFKQYLDDLRKAAK